MILGFVCTGIAASALNHPNILTIHEIIQTRSSLASSNTAISPVEAGAAESADDGAQNASQIQPPNSSSVVSEYLRSLWLDGMLWIIALGISAMQAGIGSVLFIAARLLSKDPNCCSCWRRTGSARACHRCGWPHQSGSLKMYTSPVV